MARRLPPFAAVRAFEAVARHLSVKDAAEELCLSPSAVSHQLRALEEYFDTALIERKNNSLQLTLTGRAYSGRLSQLLDMFDESTRQMAEVGHRPFRLLCTPSFAARWLVPRLDRLSFADRVRLRIADGLPSTDFASNDADLVIQWADDPIKDVVTEPLMSSARYPVISPELKEREKIESPEDLLRVPLIHYETMDGWEEWFQTAGIEPPVFPRGPSYPHCELAITAAERGQGVSISFDSLVRDALAEGRLVRLFNTSIRMPFTIYSIAFAESRQDDPMIREFSRWIHAEVAAEGSGPESSLEQQMPTLQ